MSAFHVMEQPARPRSLTNLALHLGGSNQLLPFHVQPNYLLESLFKPKEEERRGGGRQLPPPSPFCMELITVFSSGRSREKTRGWNGTQMTASMLYLPVQ